MHCFTFLMIRKILLLTPTIKYRLIHERGTSEFFLPQPTMRMALTAKLNIIYIPIQGASTKTLYPNIFFNYQLR
jgi:hypothetical protein